MGKNTFGKTMPRALSQNLKIMGEQIMLARKRRHLSMQDIADRATVTRLTVSKVEHGDPTFPWESMRVFFLHLIWKRISPCWLPTTLLADSFRMQNYSENEKDYSLRRF